MKRSIKKTSKGKKTGDDEYWYSSLDSDEDYGEYGD